MFKYGLAIICLKNYIVVNDWEFSTPLPIYTAVARSSRSVKINGNETVLSNANKNQAYPLILAAINDQNKLTGTSSAFT